MEFTVMNVNREKTNTTRMSSRKYLVQKALETLMKKKARDLNNNYHTELNKVDHDDVFNGSNDNDVFNQDDQEDFNNGSNCNSPLNKSGYEVFNHGNKDHTVFNQDDDRNLNAVGNDHSALSKSDREDFNHGDNDHVIYSHNDNEEMNDISSSHDNFLNQTDHEDCYNVSNDNSVLIQDDNKEINQGSNDHCVFNQGNKEDLNDVSNDHSVLNQENHESGLSEGSHTDFINESDSDSFINEMSDNFDDDVADPNWVPRKRKRNDVSDSSTSESETECENSKVKSHQNLNDPPSHEYIVESTVDHEEIIQGTESPIKTARGKPGRPQPNLWIKNVNKYLRMTGKRYKGVATGEDGKKSFCKDRNERILSDRNCSKRCSKRTCCSNIDEIQRRTIFDNFWEMNWDEKKTYVTSMVDVCVPKYGSGSRRKQTMKYTLISKGVKVPVCKNMFLSTLGIGEFTVYSWIKAKNGGGRGKHNQPKQESEAKTYARDFLKELPKLPSHYCRMSSSKLYLEPDFHTISQLYQFYTRHCSETEKPKISYKTFKGIFTDLNLALFHPKKDQCDTCCAHQTGNITDVQYNEHIKRKEEARKEKSEDKSKALSYENLKVITLDLQSVLLSPRLKASALYYKTKLACHNYTVFDVSSKQVSCYFWHEGVFGLSADAFASCIYDYVNSVIKPGLEEIIIYSDGCCYQNRNVTVANTLLLLALKHRIVITQKYLEKGHTQMEVDSVHSTIERKLRNRDIYVPADYVTCIKAARLVQPYDVKYLSFDFFRTFSVLRYYTSIRPGLNAGDSVVTDLRVLRYCPNGTIQYKLHFSDEFIDIPRRTTRGALPSEADIIATNAPAKIKESKYNHLQQLKHVIPQDYHGFYDALLHEK